MGKKSIYFIAEGAIIAAVYVVLTMVFAPISFKEIQVRISEALTILPYFSLSAVPGLFVGCLIANIIGGSIMPDIIFGSLATLIGAVFTRLLRKKSPFLASVPPIVSNMVIIPFVLRYGYGVPLAIPLMMLTVGVGELISAGVLGMILLKILEKNKKAIFKAHVQE